MRLRCDLERRGVRLPRGLHAKDDSHATRDEVFDLVGRQQPRIDVTFLYKARAHPVIRERSHWLYKLAWYSHFKALLPLVSRPGDTLYVIVATLTTNRRLMDAREALADVCREVAVDREVVLCIWDAQSAWGIQVAIVRPGLPMESGARPSRCSALINSYYAYVSGQDVETGGLTVQPPCRGSGHRIDSPGQRLLAGDLPYDPDVVRETTRPASPHDKQRSRWSNLADRLSTVTSWTCA